MSHHQQALFFRDAYGRLRPTVELQIVRFNPVAEDDAVSRHFGHDAHPLALRDPAYHQAGLCRSARIGLAHEIMQVAGIPRERAVTDWLRIVAEQAARRRRPSGIDAFEPAGRSEAGRDDDAARRFRLGLVIHES